MNCRRVNGSVARGPYDRMLSGMVHSLVPSMLPFLLVFW